MGTRKTPVKKPSPHLLQSATQDLRKVSRPAECGNGIQSRSEHMDHSSSPSSPCGLNRRTNMAAVSMITTDR
jgi:hypothetical protein